jgi:phage terminase large subunit-like protein
MLILTECPAWPLPTEEEFRRMIKVQGEREACKYIADRETAVRRAKADPYKYGWVFDHWSDAEKLLAKYDRLLVSGGNRSGKSMFGGRAIMRRMVQNPGSRVAAFSMTSASSVRDQQPAVFNYIPRDWKNARKSKTTDVTYSQKNGFTENTFILPNGSQCFFFHYSQQNDILEGSEFDLIWFDELVPHSWVATGAYRLITRKGKMLITVTPITGWTPVVNDFMNGSTIVRTRPAALLDPAKVHVRGCPPGHMPYTSECMRKDSSIIFFPTECNPFQPVLEIKRVVQGETEANRKIRAYGWVERQAVGYFSKFSKHHIVPESSVPAQGTNYMVVDPAGSRMWFALWMRIAEDGAAYVYREFPDLRNYGHWAEIGEKPEGEIGDAAKPQGWGLSDYKRTFLDLEKGEGVFERLIDPRAGGTPHQTDDGSETTIELLGNDPDGMHFVPASGVHIEQGISAVNEMMSYNIDEPVSGANKPRLFISDACGNLIRSIQNISPVGGDRNRWKDPIDCLRYLAVHGCNYVDAKRNGYVGPRGGY